MLNLTLLNLNIQKSTTLSPFINTRNRLITDKSSFSYFFTSVFKFENSATIKRTSFRHTLNSAIYVDTSSYKNQLIKSTETPKSDSEITFNQCDFYKCSSSDTGGAIDFKNAKSSTKVTISRTGFYQCSAKVGAAFDANVDKFELLSCCFSKCSATEKSSAFSIKSSTAVLKELYIESTNGPYAISINNANMFTWQYSNHSSNRDSRGSFLQLTSGSLETATYLTFENNDIWQTLFFTKIKKGDYQYINFYHDSSKNTIELGEESHFFNCYFIDERSDKIIVQNSYVLRLQDILFSGTEEEKKQKFPISGGFIDVTVGAKTTYDVGQKPSAECWLLLPTGDTPSNGTMYKIFFICAICVLAIALIVLICKLRRRRWGLSTDKLAYTL